MMQEMGDIFIILFGIVETEVICHIVSRLPEQIPHDE